MGITRIDNFEVMRVAYAPSLQIAKDNIQKLYEKEQVLIEAEKMICIKLGGKLYKIADLQVVV